MKILEILGRYLMCGAGAWVVTVLVMIIYGVVEILKNEKLIKYIEERLNMLDGGNGSMAISYIKEFVIWPVYIPITCGQITELIENAKEQMVTDLSRDN